MSVRLLLLMLLALDMSKEVYCESRLSRNPKGGLPIGTPCLYTTSLQEVKLDAGFIEGALCPNRAIVIFTLCSIFVFTMALYLIDVFFFQRVVALFY